MSRTVYQYGNATMPPATIAAAASLLANCDPTLQGLLAGLKWALNHFLGTAWANACQGFGGDVVVAGTYAVDPIDEVARVTWQWPALIAWRGETRFGKRTLHFDGQETDVHVVYTLPPLSLEFLERLGHVRVAVTRVCRMFVEEHGHPSYTAGGDNWLTTIGVDSLALVDAVEGDSFKQMNAQQRHVGVQMTFVMKEREMLYDADMDDRTASTTVVVLDDGVSEELEAVTLYSGGAEPVVAITVPDDDFDAVEDELLVVSGTCSASTVVEVWMRVDRGVWFSLGRLSVVGLTTFSVSRLLTSGEVGEVDLKAIAEGPGGETESDEVSGTVTGTVPS